MLSTIWKSSYWFCLLFILDLVRHSFVFLRNPIQKLSLLWTTHIAGYMLSDWVWVIMRQTPLMTLFNLLLSGYFGLLQVSLQISSCLTCSFLSSQSHLQGSMKRVRKLIIKKEQESYLRMDILYLDILKTNKMTLINTLLWLTRLLIHRKKIRLHYRIKSKF